MSDPLTAVMIGSAVLGAGGSIMEGNEAAAAGDFESAQLRAKASDTRGAGQRAAIEANREADLLRSRAVAVGAASGGGYDKSMETILSGIASEGRYRSLSSLYESETAANSLDLQAASARKAGKRKRVASYITAGTQLLSGGAALYGKPPTMGTDLGGQMPWLEKDLGSSMPWTSY